MFLRRVVTVVGLVLALCGTARAEVIDFTFTPTMQTGAGDLIGSFTVDNGVITGIRGAGRVVGTIDSLLSPGSYEDNNNLLFNKAPYFVGGGVSFTTSYFGSCNLYAANDVYYLFKYTPIGGIGGTSIVSVGDFSLSAIPLPAAAPLFGAALFALAGLGYGAKRRKAVATA